MRAAATRAAATGWTGISEILRQWICRSREGKIRPSGVRIWMSIWSSVAARLRRERAVDAEHARGQRVERQDAGVCDLEAGRGEPLGVEAPHLVERGPGRDLERMKAGRRLRRGDPARLHHQRAGIVRHPARPRQMRAEFRERLAAVLMEADRTPRPHDAKDQRAGVGRAEHQGNDKEQRNEPAHGAMLCARAAARSNHKRRHGEREVMQGAP